MYPWARSYPWAKVSVDGLDALKAWFERVGERPAVKRAVTLPRPVPAFFGEGDVEAEEKANADRFKHELGKR